ncbi:hypothetical protein GOP47_0011681 [Adiantum capillus-veneris]|uniref:Uncharacterized protein n=1 Tax=Adiantum capillus-veneris TaxID=13818 RepID=A0A9D4UUM2_ADICA|nr:hypothetical protein GOP47_0011681 [Adiantum capillus-veneris]
MFHLCIVKLHFSKIVPAGTGQASPVGIYFCHVRSDSLYADSELYAFSVFASPKQGVTLRVSSSSISSYRGCF